MSKTPHVVIVGGGVIGLSTAFQAARRGCKVTLLERNGPVRTGCSTGNVGMVVPSHFIPLAAPGAFKLALKWMFNPRSPFYVKPRLDADLIRWGLDFWRSSNAGRVAKAAPFLAEMHLASRADYLELAKMPGFDFGLVERGLLMLCKTEHALADEARVADQGRKWGVPSEVLTPANLATLEPGVSLDVRGAVYFPKDCHFTPERFMDSLQRGAAEAGVEYRWNTPVTGWTTSGGRIVSVRTPAGEVAGDEFVIAGGSWSPQISRDLGLRLPIQAGRGYTLTLQQPRQHLEICSICVEARIAITPMGGTLRVGGTMEVAGCEEKVNPLRIEGITRSFPTYYTGFRTEDFNGVEPWVGLRPVAPDGLPYLGRSRKWNNLVLSTGHAMMGMSLAPVTGRLTADLLTDTAPALDITLMDPDRFG
jgi:D-amino-acid dehydrogenase